jgi:hypothetical protein
MDRFQKRRYRKGFSKLLCENPETLTYELFVNVNGLMNNMTNNKRNLQSD